MALKWRCPYPKTAHLTLGTALDEAARLNKLPSAREHGKSHIFECPHALGVRRHWHCGRRPVPPTSEQLEQLERRFNRD